MNLLQDSSRGLNSKRRRSESSLLSPGPGAYNIKRDLCDRTVSFNKARKSPVESYVSPGPGSYIIPSCIGKGPKIIISKAKVPLQAVNLPGPSDYSPIYSGSTVKYSFPKKEYNDKCNSTPGPGSYDLKIQFNGPRPVIGRAKRLLLKSCNNSEPQSVLKSSQNRSKHSVEKHHNLHLPKNLRSTGKSHQNNKNTPDYLYGKENSKSPRSCSVNLSNKIF
jgi:Sperm-tail PG-rich repeat